MQSTPAEVSKFNMDSTSFGPVPCQSAPTMALACGLTGTVLAYKIASCVCPPALSDHTASVRLADVTGPQSIVEGRRNHGVASRGGSATAPGRTPEAGLGRSSRSRGTGPMAAGSPARSSTGHPGDTADMASTPATTSLDLPAPARASRNASGTPRPDPPPGAREPRMGPSTSTRGAGAARLPDQRGDRAADPAIAPLRTGAPDISTPPGGPSYAHRPRGSWPATSSTLTRSF
jgi:hypothetical protein